MAMRVGKKEEEKKKKDWDATVECSLRLACCELAR